MGGVLQKNVWLVKDTVKKGHFCLPNYKASMFFSCQLKNEGLPYSCAQS